MGKNGLTVGDFAGVLPSSDAKPGRGIFFPFLSAGRSSSCFFAPENTCGPGKRAVVEEKLCKDIFSRLPSRLFGPDAVRIPTLQLFDVFVENFFSLSGSLSGETFFQGKKKDTVARRKIPTSPG